jgi:prevent-host-death family protein
MVFLKRYSNNTAYREIPAMTRLAVTKAYEDFSDILDRVAAKKERIVLQRQGKDIAVLVPLEDLALLEKLEDRADMQAALHALNDPTDDVLDWEQAKKELDAA